MCICTTKKADVNGIFSPYLARDILQCASEMGRASCAYIPRVDNGSMKRTPSPFVERRSTHLLAATQRALWPLMKLLVRRGISYPALAEALKALYVNVARREFPLSNKRDTTSRLSILTGIHRRDVKRLTDKLDEPADVATSFATESALTATELTLSAKVIAVWTGVSRYLDAAGKPKPLHRLARKSNDESFESLVREVNRDVRPRALLDEWRRSGAVTVDSEDRICLNLENFMAKKSLDEKAFYLGHNIHDHLAAIAHNLTVDGDPLFERCVYYGGITSEAVDELQRLARDEGMKGLQILNRRALELISRDADKPHARFRMTFGVYFYGTDTVHVIARDQPGDGDE